MKRLVDADFLILQIVDVKKAHPFRSAVIRGLGVLTPPLMTVVILLWVINTTREYLLVPVNTGVREAIVWCLSGQIREGLTITDETERIAIVDGVPYQELRRRPIRALVGL